LSVVGDISGDVVSSAFLSFLYPQTLIQLHYYDFYGAELHSVVATDQTNLCEMIRMS
jgi:hypothetical protein